MPTAITQEVRPDEGYDWLNKVTVVGDSALTSYNIKMGTEIFGVPGTYVGGYNSIATKLNNVNFIDYDGTVIYSYSLEELSVLTELPPLPEHKELICQGWNWTLDAIKALNRPVTVGAMYITDDGATRLHIRIATVGRMTVPLYIGQTVANSVSIDWGDGSAAETLAGTGNVNTTHIYAEPGDYVISLMPEDGCTLSFGANSSLYCVMGSTENNGKVYCNMLQDVYIGKNVTSIGSNAFNYCYSLTSVTIPNGVTSIGRSAFSYCYGLTSIIIPDGVTSISDYAFNGCQSLTSITIPNGITSIGISILSYCDGLASVIIPDGVTSIGSNAFTWCYSLASVTIPDSVTSIGDNAFNGCQSIASITIPDEITSIGNYAFSNCNGMRYYDFSTCTSIPTLKNTNAFNNIPSDCQMLIPAALFDEWSTATNWATYASYMVAV